MNRKEIIEILRQAQLSPSKKFGQNFLCNEGIVNRIVDAASLRKHDHVLEIGPGLGCMTERISDQAGRITAVEIDAGLYTLLERKFHSYQNVSIVHMDFLKYPVLEQYTKVLANLPYYCASEIIFKVAREVSADIMVIMLQKEMADRILARPGSKIYGALTASLHYYYTSEIVCNVDKHSFHPQPDVTSTVLKMSRNTGNALSQDELSLFHALVKAAFWGRRKTIKKAFTHAPHLRLSDMVVKKTCHALGIDETIRGEQLSTDDFIRITHYIYLHKNKEN